MTHRFGPAGVGRLMLWSCGFTLRTLPHASAADPVIFHTFNLEVCIDVEQDSSSSNSSAATSCQRSSRDGLAPLTPIVLLHGVGIGIAMYAGLIQLLAATGEWAGCGALLTRTHHVPLLTAGHAITAFDHSWI